MKTITIATAICYNFSCSFCPKIAIAIRCNCCCSFEQKLQYVAFEIAIAIVLIQKIQQALECIKFKYINMSPGRKVRQLNIQNVTFSPFM